MEQIYTSKIDTWLALVLFGAVAACLIVFVFAFRTGSTSAILVTLPVLIIGAGFPVWLMTGTTYTLSSTSLLVKSGPFKWQVPIKQITSITPTSNPLSSPALSLDRLRIDYGRGQSIMISPKDKAQFIQDLEARRGKNR
ncbi:MAG: PH domain-containing protein [Nitrincola lacisaponensis]|uniref:PH domain-containing protein n=1 Tax=Nitrincola lacisaponensis TaxID=267850 RepID=UPI00391A0B46